MCCCFTVEKILFLRLHISHLEPFSNKVVCFTRSSPELHGLPAFNSATSKIDDPVFADVKKIIYDNVC